MRSVATMLLGVAVSVAASACGPAARAPATAPVAARASQDSAYEPAPAARAALRDRALRADSVRRSYTAADVAFMTGMIHHHAQALVMSRMAPTHGASSSLQLLAERIINGQKGEIALMQRWLRDRNEPVPEVAPAGMAAGMDMPMHGDHNALHMPGMLTPEQLDELDAARGAEWDRLFLTYMIQHHQGALTMVDELFGSGGGQGDAIFKIASGIGADQASEIDRMQSMLYDMVFETGRQP